MIEPAVILADEPRVVLAVARSLQRCAVPVALIHSGSAARVSRSIAKSVRVPPPQQDFAAYTESAIEALRTLRPSLIIPSSDSALRFVADNEATLAQIGRVAAPGANAIRAVLDKNETMRVAAECGVPVPRTFEIPSLTSAREQRASLPFPLIVKPRTKRGPARFKVKYLLEFSALEWEFLHDEHFGRDYLIQERIEGHGVGVGVLLHRGSVRAMFQHRRIKELPPSGGVAVTAVSEPVDPALAEHSVRLLRALEWDGVAMVEFKRSDDGRVGLMEVNGRFWGTSALPIAAGVDLPRYLWEQHRGTIDTVPAGKYRAARFCWSAGELARVGALAEAREASAAVIVGDLVAACANLIRPAGHAVFRVSDPMPAVLELYELARGVTRRAIRSVVRRLIPSSLLNAVRQSRDLSDPARRVYLKRFAQRAIGIRDRVPHGPVGTVLFVCHGNIMRSAFAGAYLQARGTGAFTILSAGTRAKQGRGAQGSAIQAAAARGISLDDHSATLLNRTLVDQADLILVMDFRNEANVLANYPDARNKVVMLGAFGDGSDTSLEVKDPYGEPLAQVDACFARVARHVDQLSAKYAPSAGTSASKRP